jgi:hypothetical protein
MRDARGDEEGEKSGLAVGDKNKIDMPHRGRWTRETSFATPSVLLPCCARVPEALPTGVQWDVQR